MFKRALTKYKFVFSSDNTHQIMFPVTDTPTRFKQSAVNRVFALIKEMKNKELQLLA